MNLFWGKYLKISRLETSAPEKKDSSKAIFFPHFQVSEVSENSWKSSQNFPILTPFFLRANSMNMSEIRVVNHNPFSLLFTECENGVK